MGGLLFVVYVQGLVVGQSVYDKCGFVVESGIECMVVFLWLLMVLGVWWVYVVGVFEGGSIVQFVLECYLQQFVGVLVVCGVVGGWVLELNYIMYIWVFYNVFVVGSVYELFGVKDVMCNVGGSVNKIGLMLLWFYLVVVLWFGGEVDLIIWCMVSVVLGVQVQSDIGIFGLVLLIQFMGVEDFWVQVGGVFVDNCVIVYYSLLFSDVENVELNCKIQWYVVDLQVLVWVQECWMLSGYFIGKLYIFYNVYDLLVFIEYEGWLCFIVVLVGNSVQFVQVLVFIVMICFLIKVLGF